MLYVFFVFLYYNVDRHLLLMAIKLFVIVIRLSLEYAMLCFLQLEKYIFRCAMALKK